MVESVCYNLATIFVNDISTRVALGTRTGFHKDSMEGRGGRRILCTQYFNPLIHKKFRKSKSEVAFLPPKGPTELFQAFIIENERRWQVPGR